MANPQLSVRLALVVAVVPVVFLLIGGRAEADLPPPTPIRHVVEEGDTLWGIAASVASPEHDIRRIVDEIERVNSLTDATIHPGQVLVVPVAYP